MQANVLAAPAKTRLSMLSFFLPLLLTACGLAMSNEDRLDRAEEAMSNEDYRAAIIDAKDVLRKEPDNVRGRLLLGRASVAIGDGASAEKELQRAIALGTPTAEVAVDLARALLQQGRFQELIDELTPEKIVSVDSRFAITLLRGNAYLGLGETEDARRAYTAVLDHDGDSVDARLGIVSSHVADRNLIQARGMLDEILTTYSDDVRAWLISGSLNVQLGDFQGAQDNYAVAKHLSIEQQDEASQLQSLAGLAQTLLAQEEFDDARDVVSQLSSFAPDSLLALLYTARIAYLDEDWSAAQQKLQEVLRVAPEHLEAKMLLGAVQLHSGNLSQAEMYLSSVVAAAPEYPEARGLLAQTRILMDKLDEAQQTLQPIVGTGGTDPRFLSMAARASVGLGQFDDAVAFLEQSLAANPSNLGLQFQLAMTYLDAGKSEDAERVLRAMDVSTSSEGGFQRDALIVATKMRENDIAAALTAANELVNKWPENPAALNLRGSVHMTQESYAAARKDFEAAAGLAGEDVTSKRYLGALEEAVGNLDAAKAHYKKVLDNDPDAAWAMFSLARIAAREEDRDTAGQWLERIRSGDSNTVEVSIILARLYIAEQDFDLADGVIGEALEIDSSNAQLHNLRGTVLFNKKEYADAVDSFSQAAKLDQAEANYRLNLARSHKELGDEAKALRMLEEPMDASLAHIPSAVMIALLKSDNGDLDGAMAIAGRLKTLHPDSPEPHALEGELRLRQGDLLEASRAYDRALEVEISSHHALRSHAIKRDLGLAEDREPLVAYLAERPMDSEVRIVLAQSYERSAKVDESIVEYEAVVTNDPNNVVALNNLAWAYQLANDKRAEATARRAYALQADNGAVVDTLGWILAQSGSYEESVELLRKAARLEDGRAEIRYHLAFALAQTGQSDEARQTLEEILAGDEPFASRNAAKQLLAKL